MPLSKAKRVSFDEMVVVKFCLHIEDYTDDEVRDSFYIHQESQRIRKDVKLIVKLIESDIFVENDVQCRRGLERKTKEGIRRRNERTINSREVVLKEQVRQRAQGDYDDDKISQAYKKMTRQSRNEAYLVGFSDAKVADALCAFVMEELKSTPFVNDCRYNVLLERQSSFRAPRQIYSTVA
jgi:hypothetical protein